MTAEFLCLKCGFRWQPQVKACSCPTCGHDYVKWLNWEQWSKSPSRSEAFRKVYQ